MAYYAYKEVRDLLPQDVINRMGPDYEGSCDYDGDMWSAAALYIEDLLEEIETLKQQLENK